MASPELTAACRDLCAGGMEEGVVMFVIHTMDDGSVRYIGPQLPGIIAAKMLRTVATGYEQQMGTNTLQ
jgi:hypothetical protein